MTAANTMATDGVPPDGSRYDAIVVGSGHNGLIAAGYLAKAGKKVLVLERRSIIGGATVTEEWFPGYRLSTCSYVCNLLLPEVISDLELERHGYEVRPFDPQYFVPFPDGSYFMSFLDGRQTREQIAKFSQRDVAGYDAYWETWDRIVERMRPLLLQPAPTWDQIEARFSGPQGQEDWRTLTRKSIAELLDEYFESEQIKAPSLHWRRDRGQRRTDDPRYLLCEIPSPHRKYCGAPGGLGFRTRGHGQHSELDRSL